MGAITTRLSTKGQLILPKQIRDALNWTPGMEIEVEQSGGQVTLKPAKPRKQSSIDDVFGCLKYDGPPVSIDEMDAAIEEEVRARAARGRY